MSAHWLIASLAISMAAPGMATTGTVSPPSAGGSVAKQLYPTSPISDEGWQALVHIVRIEADGAQRNPDSRKADLDDNRQG